MEKTRPSKQLHPGKLKQHKYYACSSDKANDQDVRRTIINLQCNTICKFKFINICCYMLPNPRNSWVVITEVANSCLSVKHLTNRDPDLKWVQLVSTLKGYSEY